jgi:hypothetical protein
MLLEQNMLLLVILFRKNFEMKANHLLFEESLKVSLEVRLK